MVTQAPDASAPSARQRIQDFWDRMNDANDRTTFDKQLTPHLHLLTSTFPTPTTPSTTTFALHVHPTLANGLGSLHGGAVATILDLCTSLALIPIARPATAGPDGSPPFWENPGVSRTLDCVYHRPALVGDEVRVVCTVVSAGRRMAHVRGEIRAWAPAGERGGEGRVGEVLSSCEHGKVAIGGRL